jgi:hypothetical protein
VFPPAAPVSGGYMYPGPPPDPSILAAPVPGGYPEPAGYPAGAPPPGYNCQV